MTSEAAGPQTRFPGDRIADEAIYDNRAYFDRPKEYFKVVLDEIETELGRPDSLLDVGCANGAFLYRAGQRFPGTELKGLEPVKALVDRAVEYVENLKVIQGGLFDTTGNSDMGVSTAVTMLGVMGIFFEPDKVIKRLLSLTASGGGVFVFSPFNEEPIDVVLNYRRSPRGVWETGHNLFSKVTIESICADYGVSCRWLDFSMLTPIPKTADPMRSWTEPFRGHPHHLLYGTNMFSTMKLLVIRKP